ncbi:MULTISPECIES: hypothetical protein [unclassified Neptuniibacter]|jgi:hypothetical protein|uniref:hypothetical protein n=1 Tax=unclassified Neptuniibacter TaxID=2630693 RepID=UPI000C4DA862|nr:MULTISPECIES: hypothetical protein [unclassified Neptuniibacter]MAY41011.1 hypothetical protein [Oceanospirillaceae bacterium]|tara:strand:- start:11654 stop:12049 length:396 start_codon:yes stop_codon:yes gene_type:complete
MSQLLSAEDKFDIQQNFRRYMRLKDSNELANDAYKTAKANRIWIAGIILLLFALSSVFFLGAAAGLFGVYFYNLIISGLDVNSSDESIEELDRWFITKQLKFEGRILYFSQDELLENPIDPFNEACFSTAE